MCVCMYAWLCYWGTTHPFPLNGGPLTDRSIVTVPCPLPGDIHHRGAPEPPPLLSKPRGRTLMRARSPHPSGPYGDLLQYSTGNRSDHTCTPVTNKPQCSCQNQTGSMALITSHTGAKVPSTKSTKNVKYEQAWSTNLVHHESCLSCSPLIPAH